jgi:hypothetical protein
MYFPFFFFFFKNAGAASGPRAGAAAKPVCLSRSVREALVNQQGAAADRLAPAYSLRRGGCLRARATPQG